jgi:glutamine amidotransferase
MQVLFADSDENGSHSGIKIWPTSVSKLHAPVLPHMGWNSVEPDSNSTLFAGVEGESFYFVHSYAARDLPGAVNTYATHGEKFLAATEDGALSATQFHPEKSGRAGLVLIKNWSKTL